MFDIHAQVRIAAPVRDAQQRISILRASGLVRIHLPDAALDDKIVGLDSGTALQGSRRVSVMTLRRWHSYIGSFVAPSVLFFTITGAVQLFNLHEDHGSYHAPVLLEKLSSLHKDQVLEKHEKDDKHEDASAGEGDSPASRANEEEEPVRSATLALKWFFFVVAVGVVFSTSFGVWMSFQTPRKRLPLTLLLCGTLLPLLLLLF